MQTYVEPPEVNTDDSTSQTELLHIKDEINQSKLDDENSAGLRKFVFTSISGLAENVKKICPYIFDRTVKMLKRAVTVTGSVGKKWLHAYDAAFFSFVLWLFKMLGREYVFYQSQQNLGRQSSKRISLPRIFRKIKRYAFLNTELPADGRKFCKHFIRSLGIKYVVPKNLVDVKDDSFVVIRTPFLIGPEDSLRVITKAYMNFHKQCTSLTKQVAPLTVKENALPVLVSLRNVISVTSIEESYIGREYDKSVRSCKHPQSIEYKQLIESFSCFVVSKHSLLSSESDILAHFKLLSLAVEVFARDLQHCATRKMQTYVEPSGVQTHDSTSQIGLHGIKDEINKNGENSAVLLKFVFTSISGLSENVKKICPHTFKRTVKILKRAVTVIGSVGKKLTVEGLDAYAVAILSPFWPLPTVEKLSCSDGSSVDSAFH